MKNIVIVALFLSSFAVQAANVDGVNHIINDGTSTGGDLLHDDLTTIHKDGTSKALISDSGYRAYNTNNRTILPDSKNPGDLIDTHDIGN